MTYSQKITSVFAGHGRSQDRSEDKFDIAVIIPVFKHSVYVTEAVISVLEQKSTIKMCAVIIDDGCPFLETQIISMAFAACHRNVFYLRKPNGGLSSARNKGIDFVLEMFPSVDAIYFLDADNRLTPSALEDAYVFWRDHQDAAWVYPSLNMFGIHWFGSCAGSYSAITQLLWNNFCEAGSLVARRVFEHGLRFDESMRSGYEDWEFWLQCLSAGFRGVNFEHFGLDYRRRPASMLSIAKLKTESIRTYIKEKHKALYGVQSILKLEQHGIPRFSCIDTYLHMVTFFVDPRRRSTDCVTLREYCLNCLASVLEPDTVGTPPFVAWLSHQHMEAFNRAGVLNSILYEAERLCESGALVCLYITWTEEELFIRCEENLLASRRSTDEEYGRFTAYSTLLLPRSELAREGCVENNTPIPGLQKKFIEIGIPKKYTADFDGISASEEAFNFTMNLMLDLQRDIESRRWNWRAKFLPSRTETYQLVREHFDVEISSNYIKCDSATDIAFVLSRNSTDGEKLFFQEIAAALKSKHANVHLVFERETLRDYCSIELDLFDSIRFSDSFADGFSEEHLYNATPIIEVSRSESKISRFLGCFADVDIVLHLCSATVSAFSSDLTSRGVKLFSFVNDDVATIPSRTNRKAMNALQYEHTHELFITSMPDTAVMLHAMGVPCNKIYWSTGSDHHEVARLIISCGNSFAAHVLADRR